MFDSQFCSLVTVTFFLQMFGLVTVIGYRLRGDGRFNHAGLVFGLVLMGAATLICIPIDRASAVTQGVTLVLVATGSTFGSESRTSLG
jgi:hypothetical protein